jgi:hypothetical protein
MALKSSIFYISKIATILLLFRQEKAPDRRPKTKNLLRNQKTRQEIAESVQFFHNLIEHKSLTPPPPLSLQVDEFHVNASASGVKSYNVTAWNLSSRIDAY